MKNHNNFYNTILAFHKVVKRYILMFSSLCFLISSITAKSQNIASARYEIDAKRLGVNPDTKEGLSSSREFIRLDSTYYVGYLYEGLYKYERSSDYLGYKQAIIPLQKALRLFERDYELKMRNIFSSIPFFEQNNGRFGDFFNIISTLQSCYNSIEMPDSTFNLLNKVEGYHFQRDFFYTHSDKAWLYHRNRFYNSDKFPFLKNSIEENEQMAFKECYDEIALIKKNKASNDMWYGSNHSNEDLLNTYHYLAILHDYNQNYDSSQYYYQLLIEGGRVSWSNFANMQHVVGDFAGAVQNYSKDQYKGRFSLSESSYYMPMILVYGGQTKNAILIAQDEITQSGSTPGFGWYNIALARAYLYDGQLDSCDFFLNKAANFKELHINTTLTQSHYEFTVNLLRVQLIEKKIALIKFCNTGWWYSFSALYDIYSFKIEKMLLEYALVNALSNNAERDKIVYQLFASEATVSYDESMYLLKDFCLPYFENKYNEYTQKDIRKKINRYFRLFKARFLMEQGEDELANVECEKLLKETLQYDDSGLPNDQIIDPNFEKLYAYRVLEILAKTSSNDEKETHYINECMKAYPQLMLFSGLPVKLNISFTGLQNDETIQFIKEDLKSCNVELTDDANATKVEIQFDIKGDTYHVMMNVFSSDNSIIVTNSELLFKQKEGVGKELAMRIFGKGGAVKFEKPLN